MCCKFNNFILHLVLYPAGFAGKDSLAMLRADMVVDSVEDLTHTWLPLFTAKTEEEKVSTEKAQKTLTDHCTSYNNNWFWERVYASVASMLVPLSPQLRFPDILTEPPLLPH